MAQQPRRQAIRQAGGDVGIATACRNDTDGGATVVNDRRSGHAALKAVVCLDPQKPAAVMDHAALPLAVEREVCNRYEVLE